MGGITTKRGGKFTLPMALVGMDLITAPNGSPKPLLANVVTLLRAEQALFNLCFDDFSQRPYRGAGLLTDGDFLEITDHIQRQGIHADVRTVTNGVLLIAQECRFHYVRDYLDSLTWDSIPRLEMALIDHGGAADTALNRAMTQRWFIQAVARIYEPGCQADSMLILEGEQGLRKSGFFEAIGNPWFSDCISDLGSKDSKQDIRGVWIVEMAEMNSMSKAEAGQAKAFITRRDDVFRESYGRLSESHPRQCVFAGTINPGAQGYLKDETGARRFWPITINQEIDIEAIRANRDQYWAQARAYYLQGLPWYMNTDDLRQDASEAQADRYVGDPWLGVIESFVAHKQITTLEDILTDCLQLNSKSEWSQKEQNRVSACLAHLKWQRYRMPKNSSGKRPWGYKIKSHIETGTDC